MTTSLSDLPDDIDALKAMVLSMTGVKLGEDVSERLDVIPARFRVIVTRRPKYACKACHEMIVQAAAEPHLVEAGLPTETLLAQTVVSKYADGLPLYRQEGSYARNGVELSRSLMASWMGRVGFHLDLLADRVLEHIRAGTRIFSDGTVNGHRTFPDCGLLKFPSLAADMGSVFRHIVGRFAVLWAVVRAVSAGPVD